MTVVIDASVVIAALVGGSDGPWALSELASGPLLAPHLVAVEVSNILRRAELSGSLSEDSASLAHADLESLAIEYFPYLPFADRVWELRHGVTSYDGWYVAIAEECGVPLVTLDRRLQRASGPRCDFRVPGGSAG